MNERIKQLEKQSYISFKDENSFNCLVFSREKFAELIIEKVFDSIANEGFEVYEPVIQKVKQSFGVE